MLMQRTRCDYAHSGSSGVFTGQSLTFAMAAAIALLTPFLVNHRVTAALRAEIASNGQLAQGQRVVL